jgi:hypothetical protein
MMREAPQGTGGIGAIDIGDMDAGRFCQKKPS